MAITILGKYSSDWWLYIYICKVLEDWSRFFTKCIDIYGLLPDPLYKATKNFAPKEIMSNPPDRMHITIFTQIIHRKRHMAAWFLYLSCYCSSMFRVWVNCLNFKWWYMDHTHARYWKNTWSILHQCWGSYIASKFSIDYFSLLPSCCSNPLGAVKLGFSTCRPLRRVLKQKNNLKKCIHTHMYIYIYDINK